MAVPNSFHGYQGGLFVFFCFIAELFYSGNATVEPPTDISGPNSREITHATNNVNRSSTKASCGLNPRPVSNEVDATAKRDLILPAMLHRT
jgi:hypothetical protein